jgi:hypothetical protein
MRRNRFGARWAIPVAVMAVHAKQARADEHMVLVDTIDVESDKGLGAFDISYVDPKTGLHVLSDRTNASVDFFNAGDDSFIGRVGGFRGVQATNSVSGPDGVTIIANKEVWTGDGDSTVKVIDIATFKLVDTISTGRSFRCDEMSWIRRTTSLPLQTMPIRRPSSR